ncbi:hypothetical protein BC629DRAFT_1454856 [Irpex lacteus]|nr:hypothetical protein BC629DRAFT_1548170 [Irpex lacteus]KAI0768952.1 hypothetical protein BC629DRAFT_1535752 [Irpex lacteus]KAI0826275.1 hypothetical protein BC629DRAFT_1454856 [Irpex lacteus]
MKWGYDIGIAAIYQMLSIRTFSILVNSMPDERTASKFTWLNSPLRGNQNTQTLIDMIQVGQYYARKVHDLIHKKLHGLGSHY